MVKDVVEKVNKKYGSKIAWNADEYAKYKYHVEMARINQVYSLIGDLEDWVVLTDEEGKHLNKIIKDLNDYLEYLGE